MSDRSELAPADFFVLRAPHLPVDELHAWAADVRLAGASADDADLAEKVASDRALLRARLAEIVRRPVVREAIAIASSSLARRIAKWERSPDSKDGAKVEQAIVRYLGRMASRSTPFGLFAGLGVGRAGPTLDLVVAAGVQRRVRLDMGCVVAIAEQLERKPAIRARLRYRANPSMHEVGGRLHVPALTQREEGGRVYALEAIAIDEALRTALARATDPDGTSRAAIAAALVGPEVTEAEALEYVDALIEAGVLESSLAPPLTGIDPLRSLEQALTTVGGAEEEAATLRAILASLEELETLPLGVEADRYEAIGELVKQVADVDASRPVQLDMMRPTVAMIDARTHAAIARGVQILTLTVPRSPHPELKRFADAFAERYGQREVPLADALDEESGIGFPDPSAPGRPHADPSPDPSLRAVEGWLLRKLERAWSDGASTVTLDASDIAGLEATRRDPLPASLGALVTVLGGGRVQIHSVSGASAARLLGRFCPWSEELTAAVGAHLREEERTQPDAIFAEVVHLPIAGRHANVILRPVLREHEIVFCGRSGAASDRTITIADLLVSVVGGRIVLRSKRLGREVIPRLSSAHNTQARQLAIYRFLGTLPTQGVAAGLAFSWGRFSDARTLPRVEHEGCILSPRTWNLDAAEVAAFGHKDPVARFRAVCALREARSLPRWIGLQDGDNVLPVDLDNLLSVEAAASTVKGRDRARFVELFLSPADLVAHGEATNPGRFAHELFVPFLARPARPALTVAAPRPARPAAPTIQRLFAPGSEWLSVKIYVARTSIDHVLTSVCRPLVAKALSSRAADGWFFVRYDDPDPHLRLRLHGDPAKLLSKTLPDLHRRLAPLLASGRVQRLELASYDRELERYGGDAGMALAERIFHADSEAALALTELDLGPDDARPRRLAVLLGMHRLLDDFDLDLATRIRLIGRIAAGFAEEQRVTPERERMIAQLARQERAHVDAFLGAPPRQVDGILTRRSRDARPAALQLRAERRASRLTVSTEAMVDSLLHMWNNRLLRSNARPQELVLHTLLVRYYESLAARSAPAAAPRVLTPAFAR